MSLNQSATNIIFNHNNLSMSMYKSRESSAVNSPDRRQQSYKMHQVFKGSTANLNRSYYKESKEALQEEHLSK